MPRLWYKKSRGALQLDDLLQSNWASPAEFVTIKNYFFYHVAPTNATWHCGILFLASKTTCWRTYAIRTNKMHPLFINHLTPNGHYMGRTAQLTSRCCIVYRVSQEEWTKLRESVPYVELYRYNPKHLYPSWTVTEIMAREVWKFDSCYTLIDYQIHIKTGRDMWFL